MSTECASISAPSATPRFQQPRVTLNPPGNAAAGDAPRSETSSELNLNRSSSAEIITMDISRPSLGELWKFLNEPTDKVVSGTDEDNSWNNRALGSRLLDFNDEESKLTSNQLPNQRPLENCSVNKILSPDRKISMFSAEIWTEKVLPSDSFLYPEPELVELYFDKNTTPDGFSRFGGYSTESIEVPTIWRGSNRGVMESIASTSPPLSARRSRTSSSGQKRINFDDEIWPLCPLLIPSERELSQSVLRNKYETISPERLDENSEEAATINHLGSEPLSIKDASTLDASMRSSSKQCELANNSRGSKVVEPTHEIEYQDTCISSQEKLEKSCDVEKISSEKRSVRNTPSRLQKNNLEGGDLKPGSLAEVADKKFKERGTRKQIKNFLIDYERYQTRHSENNLPSLSNTEPVNKIPDDIPSKNQNVPSAIYNEILSVDKIELKKETGEDSKSRLDARQNSFSSIKNCEMDCGVFEEQTTSCNVDETPQPSIMNSNTMSLASKNKFNGSEDCTMDPSDSSPNSEFRAIEAKDVAASFAERKIKKNRKSVKVVRFQTCGKSGDIKIDESDPKDTENLETECVRQDRSRAELLLDDKNETPDFLSVESFRQEANHLANKISRQIEIDPALDDALETLAKVERIVEGNQQTEERLRQVQPNAAIPWVTPPDAGELLAKALMRCRNYMLNNGYNRDATITINKLLTSKVQNLKQLVERQRLTLIAQEKRRSAPSARRQSTRSHHDNFTNSKEASIANEIGTYQIKLLIAGILTSTEKLVPKLTVNQAQKKSSANGSKNSTKNNRTSSDAVHSHHEELANEIENSHAFVPLATYAKKPAPSEPAKKSKKLFNDLVENRPKNWPRHYNINDSTNNFRSLPGHYSNSIGQKLPAWKPGGSHFVQSSVNITPNNQKIRSLPSSSTNKKKNSITEQNRDTKSQQRNKVTPATVKDALRISEKSIVKAHDTTSFAKVRKDQIKGHQPEMVSLDGKKVQLLNEVVETRARKPRSKSRTRTRSPMKMPKITVTEIPLEQAKEYLPRFDQKAAVASEFPTSKKASSYPKGIIRMLEELIRSSSHETSIRNASSAQIVARCNASAKEDVSNFLPLRSKARAITEAESHSPNNQDHYGSEVLSKSKSIQLKLEEKITVPEATVEVIDDVTDPRNTRKEFDLSSSSNAVGVLRTSGSKIEINRNQITEELNKLSPANVEVTAELSSEHSIGCVSSKYCQASLTSVTSREISDEIIRSQISDTAMSSCYCEKTPKESEESFETVEDEDVTRDECVQRFQRDQSVSTENGVTPKRKFVNRHAKSLEMLKDILSDQGLGIHFLSRAENEMKDRRCKCSSNRKGFVARRSSSGEIVSGTSLPDRNLSSTLFSKLATLSESESDIEQIEVATMTSANGSNESINGRRTSDESESLCNEKEERPLNRIVTVENATQFDIPLKSDVSVGDELVSVTLLPPNTKSEHNLADNPQPLYALPNTYYPLSLNHEEQEVGKSETFECKLPNDILEAFRLAAIRARNLHIAFCILKKDMPSGIIQNSKKILTHRHNIDDVNNIMPGHVQDLNEKSSERSNNPKSDLPLKIIIPRVRKNMANERSELDIEKLQAKSITRNNATGMKNSEDKMTDDKSQDFSNVDKLNLMKSTGQPNLFQIEKEWQIKGCQSPSQYPKSSISRSGDEKLIKTLHFAGKQQSFPVIENRSGMIDVTMNQGYLNANSLDHESRKTARKIQESFPGSRIQTLLKENLQRFRIDCSPIDDEFLFEDFRDPSLADLTDDEAVINETFIEAATSTSRTHLADCNIHAEVKNLLNCLLNDVTENWKSSAMTDRRDGRANLSRYRRVGKPVRRTKSDRGRQAVKYDNCSLLCGKYFSFLSGLIVSREHLLSLIYAAVCSFVFCCLQFSIYCEV